MMILVEKSDQYRHGILAEISVNQHYKHVIIFSAHKIFGETEMS